MTAQQPAVKKFIVKLNAKERDRLNALIQKGKAPARQELKAHILLKAATIRHRTNSGCEQNRLPKLRNQIQAAGSLVSAGGAPHRRAAGAAAH